MKRALRRFLKRAGNAVAGFLAVRMLTGLRFFNANWMADFCGWTLRHLGPLLPEHRIGRANLVAAFPEKSTAEIETILRGTWDNLGRLGAEFAHLDKLWDYDKDNPNPNGRIQLLPADIARFTKLRDDGKPALVFAAHLANWELPAICAANYGLDSAVLYRRPNVTAVDRWLREQRSVNMGDMIAAGLDAPVKLADALKRGSHVGILVDQYYVRGVPVTFFGRQTMANPLIARLAQHFDCPIHGVRMIRLPGRRIRGELTDAIPPARDASGKIDIAATMQRITDVVEGWVREYPEQWLWQHRRWRPEDQRG